MCVETVRSCRSAKRKRSSGDPSQEASRTNGAFDDARGAFQLVGETGDKWFQYIPLQALDPGVLQHPAHHRAAAGRAVGLEVDGQVEAAQHRLVELREIVAGEHDRDGRVLEQVVVFPPAAGPGRQHVLHLVTEDRRAGLAPEQGGRHPQAVPLVGGAVHPTIGPLRSPGALRLGFAKVVETSPTGSGERLRELGLSGSCPAVEDHANALPGLNGSLEEAHGVIPLVKVSEGVQFEQRLRGQGNEAFAQLLFGSHGRPIDALEPALHVVVRLGPVAAPGLGVGDPDFGQPAKRTLDPASGDSQQRSARLRRVTESVLGRVPEIVREGPSVVVEPRQFQHRTTDPAESETAYRESRGPRFGALGGWIRHRPAQGLDRPGQEFLRARTRIGGCPRPAAAAVPAAASEGEVGVLGLVQTQLPEPGNQEARVDRLEFLLTAPDPFDELRPKGLVSQAGLQRVHEVASCQETVVFLQFGSSLVKGER